MKGRVRLPCGSWKTVTASGGHRCAAYLSGRMRTLPSPVHRRKDCCRHHRRCCQMHRCCGRPHRRKSRCHSCYRKKRNQRTRSTTTSAISGACPGHRCHCYRCVSESAESHPGYRLASFHKGRPHTHQWAGTFRVAAGTSCPAWAASASLVDRGRESRRAGGAEQHRLLLQPQPAALSWLALSLQTEAHPMRMSMPVWR